MLRLNKQAISKYLENNCKRQLFLNLHMEGTLDNVNYPQRIVRPALQNIRDLGDQWEAEKVSDVRNAFSSARVIETRIQRPGQIDRFDPRNLATDIATAAADTFIVQGEFQLPNNFRVQRSLTQYEAPPIELTFSNLRPDLIWIRRPGTYSRYVAADGRIFALPQNDDRLQLQLIDIKLASEASTQHFTELTYYILTLAGWLDENGFLDRFVVVPNGSVWPGSLDDSALIQYVNRANSIGIVPTIEELTGAISNDLETVPFEPIAQRLSTFFVRDLIEVFNAEIQGNWTQLNWHINQGCAACEFLGIDASPNRWHPNHCHPEAMNNDLITKLPYLGRGGKAELEQQGVNTTAQLQNLPVTAQVFQNNGQLRADRRMLLARAESIINNTSVLPAGRRTTLLPESRETDLKIFLTLDFDPGSGLTYAFGFQSFWWNPRPANRIPGAPLPTPTSPNKRSLVFIVPDRNPNSELAQLNNVCQAILNAVQEVTTALANAGYTGTAAQPKVHFYIWDTVQAKHIRRVMGRHINSPQIQNQFQGLIWRFPPENILPDAEMEQKSPVSVVKSAIRQIVGLPIPYDYSLLQTARVYHPDGLTANAFNVHPLFESGLGDQIPFERAHEIWNRRGYFNSTTLTQIPWNTLQTEMERTVTKKLFALESVVNKLERDLRSQNRLLLKPKTVNLRRPTRRRGISIDGQLWLNYAQLDVVSERLEIQATRAMDVDEREAKYQAAVLLSRLSGQERVNALASLNITNSADIWVYRLSPSSSEVKMDEGDFTWALAPVEFPGFLDIRVFDLAQRDPNVAASLTGDPARIYSPIEYITQVTIVDLDREALIIAVRLQNLAICQRFEQAGYVDFSQNVVLDKIYKEYWTERLESCLRAIGIPAISTADPASLTALNR